VASWGAHSAGMWAGEADWEVEWVMAWQVSELARAARGWQVSGML
jgi:hypothetical protein